MGKRGNGAFGDASLFVFATERFGCKVRKHNMNVAKLLRFPDVISPSSLSIYACPRLILSEKRLNNDCRISMATDQ